MGSGFGLNSENGAQWYVPDTEDGIGSAVKTFGGAKVHFDLAPNGTFDHKDGWKPTNEIGYLSDLAIVEGSLEATLHVHDDVPSEVVQVIADKSAGLSIEAHADRRPAIRDGKKVVELINFRHPPDGPASVALVTHPALKGEILRIAASRRDAMSADQKAADPAKPAEPAGTQTDPAVLAAIKAEQDKVTAALAELTKERERLESERKIDAAKAKVDAVLASEKLPDLATKLIRNTYAARIEAGHEVTDDEVKASATEARKALRVTAPGADVEVGTETQDRLALRLENLFVSVAPRYVRAAMDKEAGKPLGQRLREAGMEDRREGSLLRMFREHVGAEFSDLRDRTRSKAVRASISTSTWGDAWENVLNRVFLTAYRENPDFAAWRRVTRVVPIQNFVKQERITMGGYANLATVAEGANYAAMTTPGDTGHGYTPAKYGGTEDITWEAMLRDDVGTVAGIPSRMALAAARTLYEYVFDKYTDSGADTMDYDSVTLYHSTTHSNQATTALSSTQLIAVLKTMMKQTDQTNSKRLGIMPKFLMVPIDLSNTAFDLLKSLTTFPGGATTDYEWIRAFNLELIVVRHWTDANDWYLAADPFEFPTFEMGFVGGMEEPEMYVQDDRNFGSYFDADKVTWKIRHAYGGTVLRHEGVYGNTVS